MPQEQGPLRPLAGKAICRRCHPRCLRCTAFGFHEQQCQKCAGYKRGEQCEDECPTDHYADEIHRECFPCHSECRECTGPGSENCVQCRTLKIYLGDPNDNSTAFNCTAHCTKEWPYQIYPKDQIGPYCSNKPATAGLITDNPDTSAIMVGGIVSFVIAAAILILVFYLCRQKINGDKEAVKMTMVLTGCEDAEPLRPSNVGPNLTKLRIIKEQELRKSDLLGMGAFGRVFKGVWIPENDNVKIPVAIKILLEMSGSESSKEFLEEAYIMASIEHPNLLKLLAVCMTNQMMLITQLMPLGCLLDYVKNYKNKTGSMALLNWSTQIARGMAYLEERRLVHRDLAARNVLVQNPSVVKITDFGLAKLLDSDSNEYKAAGGKMPIKWLALECIRHRVFTSKSDVWAFGVTIWELLTFGSRPYEQHPAKNVPNLIESGYKLEQPEICTLDVYCTLLSCWHLDADARPTFKQLVQEFSEYSKDPGRYLVVQGDKHMRLPSYTSQDEKDLIRTLAPYAEQQNAIPENVEYLQPKVRTSALPGPSATFDQSDDVPPSIRYCSDPMKLSGDDETDNSGREVGVGNLKLDLPLDEDDYLMPTSQNQSAGTTGGYMDLIGAPVCVDNPEYLMGSISHNSPPPTQTIGIPIAGMPQTPITIGDGEQSSSDHEYYNDLQRELQPLHRSETTV